MAYLGRYPAMASGGTVLPDDQTFKGLPATGIDSGSVIQPPIQAIGTGSPVIDPGFNIIGGPGDPGGPPLNNSPGTADSVLYPMGPIPGPNNFVMPRGTLATDLGERLRQAGLGEGVSYGGSEIQYRPDVSAGQRAAVEGIAQQPPAPPQISNADVARFIAQQNGGTLPGLPGAGGGDMGPRGTVEGSVFGGPEPTDVSSTAGQGNVSDLSNPPTAETVGGRGAIASVIDDAVNGINSPFGTAALTALGIAGAPYGTVAATGAKLGAAGLGLLGFGGTRANPDVTGNLAQQQAFENAPTQFVGTDPAALASQRSGERGDFTSLLGELGGVTPPDVTVNEAREDAPPTGSGLSGPGNISQGGVPGSVGVGQANDAATSAAAAAGLGITSGLSGFGFGVPSPTGPPAPPDAPSAPPAAPPDAPPDTSNAPDNPEGTGGTAAGGTGTGDSPSDGSGASGPGGDAAWGRGGSVNRGKVGSFKNARKFSGGGAVPMTRAERVKDFESKHGNMAV